MMFASLLLAGAAALSAPAALAPDHAPAPVAAQVPVPPQASAPPRPTPPPFAASSRPSIGFISAASLRDRCEASAAGLVSYCFAYITGVHDTVQAYETWLRVREFCPPAISAQGDMRRAFLTYLKDHPGAASGEAASVIVLAFKDQFPCNERGAGVAGIAKDPTDSR